ncbi:dockerin type I domain-containing protein, partial [Mesomycoplasma ovipneumoniae]|uniref:dockerin type I domain-containing protein n=1 Tax=Mesomycoplasma ovipneumoniae TaxID=29562 RepID=UPI00307FFC5F
SLSFDKASALYSNTNNTNILKTLTTWNLSDEPVSTTEETANIQLATQSTLIGDANRNGTLECEDITLLNQLVKTRAEAYAEVDANSDGRINSFDLSKIIPKSLPSWPTKE